MNYKSKKETRLTSLRIECELLDECKKRGVNVSYAVNLFLRAYLYIQKHDSDECPLIGSEPFRHEDLAIDVYNRRKLLY